MTPKESMTKVLVRVCSDTVILPMMALSEWTSDELQNQITENPRIVELFERALIEAYLVYRDIMPPVTLDIVRAQALWSLNFKSNTVSRMTQDVMGEQIWDVILSLSSFRPVQDLPQSLLSHLFDRQTDAAIMFVFILLLNSSHCTHIITAESIICYC